MKIWTFDDLRSEILDEDDLNDEEFITPDELVGYANDAIDSAESEILKIDEDYFLTKYYIPLAVGTSEYSLPHNIYADKIRGVIYKNGTEIYPVKKLRRKNLFEQMAEIDQFGSADPYKYILTNHGPGLTKFELKPTSRDAASFSSSTFPMVMWFIRNANRVPLTGEYCNPEVVPYSAVDTSTDIITVNSGTTTYGNLNLGTTGCYPGSITYVTGDAVKIKAGPGATLPSPLVADTVYYVIKVSATTIKLATSLANARAGTAINLTTQGTLFFTVYVAATAAIISASILDIPEFSAYIKQFVKVKTLKKEGDPRKDEEVLELNRIKDLMISTLTERIPDDDNTVEADFSSYEEMN